MRFNWLILVCFLVVWKNTSGQSCNGTTNFQINETCYTLTPTPMNLSAAVQHCTDNGLTMLTVPDRQTHDRLVQHMKDQTVNRAWLGAKETLYHWHWIPGPQTEGWVLSKGQGCYRDWEADRDLTHEIPHSTLGLSTTTAKCIAECGQLNYTYSGLQNGWMCFCGNSLGKYGLTAGCNSPCEGDRNDICGGYLKNSVYIVQEGGTTFSRWAYNQPDNGKSMNGYEACGWLNTQNTEYVYADAKCSVGTHRYICDMNVTDCQANGYSLSTDGTVCVKISTTPGTWYESYMACRKIGGELATILSKKKMDALERVVPTVTGTGFWLGLIRSNFTWTNGDTLTYFHWASTYPSDVTKECVILDSDKDGWVDEHCTTNSSFYCQTGPSVPTSPTTANPSTIALTSSSSSPVSTTTSSSSSKSLTTSSSSSVSINTSRSSSQSTTSSSSSQSITTSIPSTASSASSTLSVTSTASSTSSTPVTPSASSISPDTVSTVGLTSTDSKSKSSVDPPKTPAFTTGGATSASDTTLPGSASPGNTTTPDAGASTTAGGISTIQIILIIVICVLVFAIILGIALFIYYKKSNPNSNRTAPDRSYDARPDAAVPNSGDPTTGGTVTETPVDYSTMNGTSGLLLDPAMFNDSKPNGWMTPRKPAEPPSTRIHLDADGD